ncbi:MAG: hypothetical protein IH898_08480, partial [Planctomycetes bacterium]|nr:hypothetical protein [Planctomycetota bacterium]
MSITKSHLPQDNRPDYMIELGLAPPYTQEDVMQAYYAKAKKVHPDHGGTAEDFRALQEAFEKAKQYTDFRIDRRNWIATNMDAYLAVRRVTERLEELGAKATTNAVDWLEKSFGDFAQLTETSYFEIIKIAALPAILYYASVGYMVYIRAVNRGLLGVSTDELPPWGKILPRIHFLLPIPFMIYYLVIGDSAFLAAFKTICLIIMLKSTDLLMGIRTPWSDRTAKPFLGVSLLFGVFSYYFGLWVGAPFSWFAD